MINPQRRAIVGRPSLYSNSSPVTLNNLTGSDIEMREPAGYVGGACLIDVDGEKHGQAFVLGDIRE
jgi:hypothetical protein